MKSCFKRLIAVSLSLVMALSLTPIGTFALTPEEAQEYIPVYLDTSYSAEERAVDLVSRMTAAEKYSQLTARTAPAIQRLGIKAYDWWSEALHGVARDGKATSFPTGLGIAATWDVDMVQAITSATSDEARDKFNNQINDHGLSYWSPTINMARDPRWGRAEETYGEDSYLTSMIAGAFVKGMQGDVASTGIYKTIATVKHFLGNNSEQNRHTGSSNIDARDLREYFMRAFQYTVEKANVASIMTSYNAVNGVPMSVNEPILDDVLRRTWGFDGYVVTDCGALADVESNHQWRPEGWGDKTWNGASTAAYSINAGVDLNCGAVLSTHAATAVASGLLEDGSVDRALVRLFKARIQTGEFDPDGGYYGGDQFDNQIQSAEHVQLAEDSADSAVVLLKNNGILPLSNSINNLVLVGDCADEVILGDYSTNEPENTSTAVQGISAALKRANPDATFTFIDPNANEGLRYLMNTRGPKLLDANGNMVSQFNLSTASGASGCQIETGNNPMNIGYNNSNGCWVKFEAGSVDFTNVTQFSVEMSGTSDTLATHLEIRATDPVSGPLLGSVDVNPTGDWSNYVTNTFAALINGGYTDQTMYITLKPVPRNVEFSDAERASITNADAVIYYAGTRPGENGYSEESDGYNLNLPNNQNEIINTIAQMNQNTIVYMQAVSQINVEPFKDNVKAMLWSTYNGQAQGNAAGRILFGETNPSAKLPFTWYTDVNQLPGITDYTLRADENSNGRTYQYFKGDVTYPFGYGLSYTDFDYSNLTVNKNNVTPNDTITVEFDVTNNGTKNGKEVSELYVVSPNAEANQRPAKSLKGFDKKMIAAGSTEHFTLTLDAADLWYWDDANAVQTYDQGEYVIQVGSDSAACENLTASFTLSGQLDKKLNETTAIPSGHVLDAENPEKTITTELTASYNDQSFVNLSDEAAVIYTSADENVASVDENGVVSAVNGGVTTITASVTVDGITKTDSYSVKVNQNVYAKNIYLNNTDLTGFDPATTDYNAGVESMDELPVVSADVAEGYTCIITQATKEKPTATVAVSSGNETVIYKINFIIPPRSIDFTNTNEEELRSIWSITNENSNNWKLDENGLTITTEQGDFYQDSSNYKNLFTQSAAGDWIMEAKFKFAYQPNQVYQQAAIMAFQDDNNYIKLSYEFGGEGVCKVQYGWESNALFSGAYAQPIDTTVMYYRLVKVGNAYTGYYSLDGSEWTQMGTKEMALADLKIALVAINSNTDAQPLDVTFESMSITQTTNCTCGLYDLTTEDNSQLIINDNTSVTHSISAEVSSRGGCQVPGHNTAPVLSYEILKDASDAVLNYNCDSTICSNYAGQVNIGNYVGAIDPGDIFKIENVDFGDGYSDVALEIGTPFYNPNTYAEIYVDDITSTCIARIALANTGDWENFKYLSTLINRSVTGTHTVYVKSGSGAANFNVKSLRLSGVCDPANYPCDDMWIPTAGTAVNNGSNIGGFGPDSAFMIEDVDFGNGYNYITLTTSSDSPGGVVEIYLDDMTNMIATMPVTTTTGWDNYAELTPSVLSGNITGKHTIYVKNFLGMYNVKSLRLVNDFIDGNTLTATSAGQLKIRVTATLGDAEPIYKDVVYTVITGDVNGDKVTDIKDLVHIKKIAAKMSVEGNGDLDCDGKVAAADLSILRKILLCY